MSAEEERALTYEGLMRTIETLSLPTPTPSKKQVDDYLATAKALQKLWDEADEETKEKMRRYAWRYAWRLWMETSAFR